MVKKENNNKYSELLLQVNNDLAVSASLDDALDTLINISSSVIGAERGTAFINDNESGLHQDFETWLEGLAPEPPPTAVEKTSWGEVRIQTGQR